MFPVNIYTHTHRHTQAHTHTHTHTELKIRSRVLAPALFASFASWLIVASCVYLHYRINKADARFPQLVRHSRGLIVFELSMVTKKELKQK